MKEITSTKNDTYNRKNNENIPIDRSDGTR